jgi:hypothetical protein
MPGLAECPASPLICYPANKASLLIKNSDDPAKDQLKLKLADAGPISYPYFGSPTDSTLYLMCIYDYDQAHLTATLALELEISPSVSWTGKDPKGWTYKDKAASQGGVTSVKLAASEHSSAQLAAKGTNLSLPTPFGGGRFFNQDSSVIVQLLRHGGPICWTAQFGADDTRRNTSEGFLATK